MHVSLPLAEPVLVLAALLLAVWAMPPLATRLRVPDLLALLLTGALFGPHGLGLVARGPAVVLLGTWGLVFLILLASLELDRALFARIPGQAVLLGLVSFALPAAATLMVVLLAERSLAQGLLLGAVVAPYTVLAYPIVGRLGVAGHLAVSVAVGATLVAELLAFLVLALVTANEGLRWSTRLAAWALFAAVLGVGLPRLAAVFRRAPGAGPVEFLFVLAVAVGAGALAELVGLHPVVGAFFAALALNPFCPRAACCCTASTSSRMRCSSPSASYPRAC